MATSDTSEIQASPADASLGVEASASVAQTRRRSSRRILNDNQKREVIRLYSETTTPVPEMAKRFGIGESSLYRLVQQHGVPRRGSNPAGTQAVSREEQQSEGSKAAGTPATRPQPEKRSGRGPSNTLPMSGRAGASRASRKSGSGAFRPKNPRRVSPTVPGAMFRVTFFAEQIVTAVDVRDALRQVEAQGAADITAIVLAE